MQLRAALGARQAGRPAAAPHGAAVVCSAGRGPPASARLAEHAGGPHGLQTLERPPPETPALAASALHHARPRATHGAVVPVNGHHHHHLLHLQHNHHHASQQQQQQQQQPFQHQYPHHAQPPRRGAPVAASPVNTGLLVQAENERSMRSLSSLDAGPAEEEEEDVAAVAPRPVGPAAVLAALDAGLTRVGVTPRARSLIMLNGLVLLMATNWVSAACMGVARAVAWIFGRPVPSAPVAPPPSPCTPTPPPHQVVLKDAGGHFDPFAFSFLRFFVAAAAFSPFMKVGVGLRPRAPPPPCSTALRSPPAPRTSPPHPTPHPTLLAQAGSQDPRTLRAGAELGFWTACGYILQSVGLLTTDASRASFLSTFTVLVVPFLAGISGRGISLITWGSALVALVGVSLLEQTGADPSMGDVWSLLSAFAFGVQVFRTEHWARKLGPGSTMPLMSVSGRRVGLAAWSGGVGWLRARAGNAPPTLQPTHLCPPTPPTQPVPAGRAQHHHGLFSVGCGGRQPLERAGLCGPPCSVVAGAAGRALAAGALHGAADHR